MLEVVGVLLLSLSCELAALLQRSYCNSNAQFYPNEFVTCGVITLYRVRRNKYEVVVKTATFERHLKVGRGFFFAALLCGGDLFHISNPYLTHHDAAAVYPKQELEVES